MTESLYCGSCGEDLRKYQRVSFSRKLGPYCPNEACRAKAVIDTGLETDFSGGYFFLTEDPLYEDAVKLERRRQGLMPRRRPSPSGEALIREIEKIRRQVEDMIKGNSPPQ